MVVASISKSLKIGLEMNSSLFLRCASQGLISPARFPMKLAYIERPELAFLDLFSVSELLTVKHRIDLVVALCDLLNSASRDFLGDVLAKGVFLIRYVWKISFSCSKPVYCVFQFIQELRMSISQFSDPLIISICNSLF